MPQENIIIDSTMTFEKAMEELEIIVKSLEESSFALDEAVKMYERGTQLKKFCESKLAHAKMRIDQISLDVSDEIKLMSQSPETKDN